MILDNIRQGEISNMKKIKEIIQKKMKGQRIILSFLMLGASVEQGKN